MEQRTSGSEYESMSHLEAVPNYVLVSIRHTTIFSARCNPLLSLRPSGGIFFHPNWI